MPSIGAEDDVLDIMATNLLDRGIAPSIKALHEENEHLKSAFPTEYRRSISRNLRMLGTTTTTTTAQPPHAPFKATTGNASPGASSSANSMRMAYETVKDTAARAAAAGLAFVRYEVTLEDIEMSADVWCIALFLAVLPFCIYNKDFMRNMPMHHDRFMRMPHSLGRVLRHALRASGRLVGAVPRQWQLIVSYCCI